jgi:hypothetical protein
MDRMDEESMVKFDKMSSPNPVPPNLNFASFGRILHESRLSRDEKDMLVREVVRLRSNMEEVMSGRASMEEVMRLDGAQAQWVSEIDDLVRQNSVLVDQVWTVMDSDLIQCAEPHSLNFLEFLS